MASAGSEDGDVGFQIAPMVDVVFVLMLFFMASAGSQVAERELNINLPGSNRPSGGQAALPPTPIMVVWPRPALVIWSTASYDKVPERETIPMVPGVWINPGMMPILVLGGVIIPGQLGPIILTP